VALLKAVYPSQDVAAIQNPQAVEAYYQASYPAVFTQKRALVDACGQALKDAYLRNVSPEMKLTWGTHPNHIGHQDGGGCFRCHDGSHTTKDGAKVGDVITVKGVVHLSRDFGSGYTYPVIIEDAKVIR